MNIVLVQPEIPWNTGNVGRTCVATQSRLHLVGRLGFLLSDKQLKRAGLDYWQFLNVTRHESWDSFEKSLPADARVFFFEKDGPREIWDAEFFPESYLVFGSETAGFPEPILRRWKNEMIKIPQTGPVRSLNLSSAVSVALYEALRQTRKSLIQI